ncbi:MAG: hypothetical protein P4L99_19470 [Chthoniobacter sp.]|nr:hypothetical protein [Chthoniobacter sp.]
MKREILKAIELHDSELAAISCVNGATMFSLSPAYVHRSSGRAGRDTGLGWWQEGTLTIAGASISAAIQLPATISDGSLRIAGELHDNCIPAAGTFDGPIELQLLFDTSEKLMIRGERLTVELRGEPSGLEDFSP